MGDKADQRYTWLRGGPKEGEVMEREPVENKIIIQDAGFMGETHVYELGIVVDHEGDKVAFYKDSSNATDSK